MREIKFRGKRSDNGEWVYGGLLYSGDDCFIIEKIAFRDDNNYCETFINFRVDLKTVGQFTGKEDKNEVEIYEDDILETYAILASDKIDAKPFNVEVKWSGSSWLANGILGDYQCRISTRIGNKHDNPELLKK